MEFKNNFNGSAIPGHIRGRLMFKHRHQHENHHKHKTTTIKWVDGRLVMEDHFFVTLTEAIDFAKKQVDVIVKVYDPDGELVFSIDIVINPTPYT